VQNTPAIKVRINNSYLTNHTGHGFTEAYLLAVDCRAFDRIRFTVFLASGGIWSGLPIEAIYCDRFGSGEAQAQVYTTPELQPYTCLEGPYSVFEYAALKSAALAVISGALKGSEASYLFTINYTGGGFAECPEQYKTHNLVVLANGQLAALPNNYVKVVEPWFTVESTEKLPYRRDSKYYFAGG